MDAEPEEHKCERCGKVRPDVHLTKNPFLHDVYEDDTLYWLCDECVDFLLDEI